MAFTLLCALVVVPWPPVGGVVANTELICVLAPSYLEKNICGMLKGDWLITPARFPASSGMIAHFPARV
ncbi:hypothetical protein [Erwinia typographi]|uniref:hypothetical protein n=1 Tax=Erwinia typographi TaxID=371042 RepID=UPI000AF252B2|nr:hypothetical protein [Erwinia typographi]